SIISLRDESGTVLNAEEKMSDPVWPSRVILLGMFLLTTPALASDPVSGWRGNGTGLWPEARPPLEWYRLPRGALDGLRATAKRPAKGGPGNAPLVEKGLIRDWLVLGPFSVKDSVQDFDKDVLGGEASVEPTAGDKVGQRSWTPATVSPDDPM